MVVLGVHDSNLSSACLLVDGRVVAAVAEERLNRRKGTGRFPELGIRKVLEMSGVDGRDIDVVALGMRSSAFDTERAQVAEYRWEAKLAGALSQVLPLGLLSGDRLSRAYVGLMSPVRRWRLVTERESYFRELGIPVNRLRFYDHHTCHAAATYYNRPWRDDAVVFTCDGEGDGYSGSVWIGSGTGLHRVGTVTPAHSLGSIFSRVTRCMGMIPWRDEHKVMGLAGYRDQSVVTPAMRGILEWVELRDLAFRNRTGRLGTAFLRWARRELAGVRFDEIAAGIQQLLEDTLSGWITRNLRHHQRQKVVLGGGVFLNVKANKRVAELPQVTDVFVFPASADDSASVGAAILGYRELCVGRDAPFDYVPIRAPYLGPPAVGEPGELLRALRSLPHAVKASDDVSQEVAGLLAKGEIVARCAGRMELGPRALGNRSILAHPGRLETVTELNTSVKHRDFWMPFAPTILAEDAPRYIVNPKHLSAPYMVLAFDSTADARREIVATLHQGDRTTRPQVLERDTNPAYYSIVEAFRDATGIGAVLNTSFNLHGEPIVCDWRDALDTFRRSGLRHLVIENYLISKRHDEPQRR